MPLTVGNYQFEGPYSSTENLKDASGVYIIVDHLNNQNNPIDCGESATVKSRVENHDRKDCWNRNSSGTLMVAVLYTPHLQSSGRVAIEQEIRDAYNFPCGDR